MHYLQWCSLYPSLSTKPWHSTILVSIRPCGTCACAHYTPGLIGPYSKMALDDLGLNKTNWHLCMRRVHTWLDWAVKMALVDIGLNCACPQYTHLAGLGRKMGLVDLGLYETTWDLRMRTAHTHLAGLCRKMALVEIDLYDTMWYLRMRTVHTWLDCAVRWRWLFFFLIRQRGTCACAQYTPVWTGP